MMPSPLGPVEKMLNAVPSASEKVSEQVAQFRYAEPQLPAWSFFNRARRMARTAFDAPRRAGVLALDPRPNVTLLQKIHFISD